MRLDARVGSGDLKYEALYRKTGLWEAFLRLGKVVERESDYVARTVLLTCPCIHFELKMNTSQFDKIERYNLFDHIVIVPSDLSSAVPFGDSPKYENVWLNLGWNVADLIAGQDLWYPHKRTDEIAGHVRLAESKVRLFSEYVEKLVPP